MNFTVEEENLMYIFDIRSRQALICSIREAMPDFEEPELCEIAENVLRKLNNMSDLEFAALDLSPDYDNDETEV